MKTMAVNVKFHLFDVYVGRVMPGQEYRTGVTDGTFGKPFPVTLADFFAYSENSAATPSWLYPYIDYLFERLQKDPAFLARVRALKDKRLGCWCKKVDLSAPNQPVCHADVLAWVADRL